MPLDLDVEQINSELSQMNASQRIQWAASLTSKIMSRNLRENHTIYGVVVP